MQYLYNKKIDKSLLNEGMTLSQVVHNNVIEKFYPDLEKGQSKDISIKIEDKKYYVRLVRVNQQERDHLYQIRYSSNSDISSKIKEIFAESNTRINNGQQPIEEEFIEVYFNEKSEEFVFYPMTMKLTKIKNEFFDYLGQKNSFNKNSYKKSYKIIWLLSLFKILEAPILTNLVNEAYEIYNNISSELDLKKEFVIDSENISFSRSILRRKFLDAPLVALTGTSFISYNKKNEIISVNENLLKALTPKTLEEVYEVLEIKLNQYIENNRRSNDSRIGEAFKHILNNYAQAYNESFKDHVLAKYIRDEITGRITKEISDSNYKVSGSAGKGNWAGVPHVAIMEKAETNTTQKGLYLVYLLDKDNKIAYLTLEFGVTDIYQDIGKKAGDKILEELVSKYRKMLDIHSELDIELNNSSLGKKYAQAAVYAIKYELSDLDNEGKVLNDLYEMIDLYERALQYKHSEVVEDPDESIEILEEEEEMMDNKDFIRYLKLHLENQGLIYSEELLKTIYLSMRSKPLVLLAGISGTGKSRFVKGLAEACGANTENGRYRMISVRPDWSDSSDLLGFCDFNGTFNPGPLTEFVYEACKDNKPHFLCLDEMNLARVEHYFSDILSVVETRKKAEGRIITDKLLNRELFGRDEDALDKYSELILPDNLFFFGTVNMDESTYPFSNKVLDRANTIEFNHIDFSIHNFSYEEVDDRVISNEMFASKYVSIKDCLGDTETVNKINDRLSNINKILDDTNYKFGYRIRDEITYFITYAIETDLMDFDKAFDFCIYQKVLPKIKGSQLNTKEVITNLFKKFVGNVSVNFEDRSKKYYEKMNDELNKNENIKYPRSAEKLVGLMRSFEVDGYASFWN